ncbi:hypothetical protein GCM10008171_23810 [Methylopila jiangsuensis]|uniref:Polysaccharide pyruvyl transferase domain-containing protein n=1 Tax=Methylopila jiangsuensis TaxID=586230 RepID=A0A9W6N4F7_9HYPH|nr:polysaccharide pyruvyl transferase family protein [Methylopila jiangsuensis]MDR6286533.1 coenzyme F420-reducing hydrogenase beta subunit [Methylopila jiangsuensis]GLK77127.1 hypothetical protein GCM10008171_23810 [Methylopila jiangsuensis]
MKPDTDEPSNPVADGGAAPKLKVGVLTLPLNRNYGGNLQAYALVTALRQLGHSPVLINRRIPPRDFDIASLADRAEADTPLMAKSFTSLSSTAPNTKFIQKHIFPATTPFLSTSHLENKIPHYGFDAIIVGSDQVWRPKYARSMLSDFFLGFLPEDDTTTRRISYAASFASPSWEFSGEETSVATRLIQKFDAVSVREDNGVDLCRDHLNAAAQHVLDPTLLHDKSHYVSAFSLDRRRPDDKTLLTYILDVNDDKNHTIAALAQRLGLTVRTTDGREADPSGAQAEIKGDKSVEGWLASFHKASFVVTDSFHGVVFSIIFNKPFLAYGNPARGLARFTSLLKMFGLEERLVLHSSQIDLQKISQPVDWSAVNARLDALRTRSFRFLQEALTGDRPARPPSPAGQSGRSGPGDGTVVALRSNVSHSTGGTPTGVRSAAGAPSHVCQPLNVLCTGCGVCISESRGALRMAWNEDGFLTPELAPGASAADVPASAVKVCPFNPEPEAAVRDEDALADIFLADAKQSHPRCGRFEGSYIGYSIEYRPTSSSGGIATYVFKKLLERGDVDYLFVVQNDVNDRYKYCIFDKNDDIRKMSKTRYYPVSLDELFSVIEQKNGRVAVSGVACFIKAVRLKQYYYPEFREKIPFLLGIICGGLKSRSYTDYLAQNAGVRGNFFAPEYRVKDAKSTANDYSFSAIDENNKTHTMKMRRVGDMWGTGLFKSRACDLCTDVMTELSDISLGDAWLPDYKTDGLGNSVVITRSALAESIIQSGLESKELVLKATPITRVAQSQGGGFRHKQKAVKFRAWMAEHVSLLPMPVIRERLLDDVSIADAFVQVLRERARSKSLQYWLETKDADAFRRRIRSSLRRLKAARRQDGDNEPLSLRQPLMRWTMRLTRGRRISFDSMRAALLGGKQAQPPSDHAD